MAALLLLYALSGASGLTFEILWARQLGTVLGATTAAITLVVAVFMAGLALGGLTGARLAGRVRRPLWAYGLCELGIAAVAFAVSRTLPALEGLRSLPLRHLLALLCLIIPSALMGLTYPLVVEAYGRRSGARAGGGGLLYGLNTGGAALGCLAAGYLGVGFLGVRGTATVAALINLGCGLGALLLATRWGAPGGAAGPRFVPEPVDPPAASDAAADLEVPTAPALLAAAVRPRTLVLAVAFACGAVGLAAEVLWTRALIPYLNSSTYAFTAILTVFLLALSAGAGGVWRRVRGLTPVRAARALLALELGLALAIALTPRQMELVERLFEGYVGVRRVMSVEDWLATVGGVFLRTAAVIGLPALLMGAAFPLCLRLLPGDGGRGGRGAGLLGAANTCGGILGSVGAGFFLLPAVGVLAGIETCAGLCLGIALALAIGFPDALRGPAGPGAWLRGPALLALTGLGLVAAWFSVQGRVPFVGRLAVGHDLVLLDEGPQDTTAVVDIGGPQAAGGRTQRLIYSNGISYTGDNAPSRRYMRLLGHLPALLADDPGASLVICIGTGMTAAALARHPEVRVLDLVDISPVVRRTLPLFAHVNDRVFADPRAVIHLADGRQFMGRAGKSYGVVTLEPPPPRAAGAASLYTVQMYQRARQALRPGGMIAQWLPLHGLTDGELRLLTRSFLAVFPHAALFMLNPNEAALLGSPGPLVIDLARLRGRLAAPGVRQSLAGIGFHSDDPAQLAEEILGLAPLQGPALAALAGPGPLVTDDRPLVETFAAFMATAPSDDQEAAAPPPPAAPGAPAPEDAGRAVFMQRLLAASWAPLAVRDPAPEVVQQRLRLQLERLRAQLGTPAGVVIP